jgi:hypothetical protein
MNDARIDRADPDGPDIGEVLAILDRHLSRSERLRYLAVGLASFVVTAVTGSLWATETSLPLRTHLAFGGIVGLGTAWMAVVTYVLTRRRPLYAADRVLATGLAVGATSIVGIATTVLAGIRGGVLAGVCVGAVAMALVAAGAVLHLSTRRKRDALLDRRRRLAAAPSAEVDEGG